MQQPRRTTEIAEDIATTSKRMRPTQPRLITLTGPSPLPTTASKYATRSRAASSSDRGSCATLGLPPNSTTRGTRGTTPLKTPVPSQNTARVLFPAEKQRSAALNAIPLHNDKKWVAERTQYITEYLREVNTPTPIKGLTADFFSRANCLRQMSIKQFVAIVNFFLQFIWGTRFQVGTNYVDDIVSILQRLHYPHQLNKSWLKAPNTQHSFGNIILLLDFLMDFAPPVWEEQINEMVFDFQEQTDKNISSTRDEQTAQALDMESEAQIIRNAEEGFMLWDKQLMDDFLNLQLRNCDALVTNCCGVEGLKALETEAQSLQQQLDELKQQCPVLKEKQEEEQCLELKTLLRNTTDQVDRLKEEVKSSKKHTKTLSERIIRLRKDIASVEKEINEMKSIVRGQIYSVENWKKHQAELEQDRHLLQCQDRALRNLEEQDRQKQVLLSRTKKQVTDQIEKYNARIREIIYSQLYTDANEELQLPRNATEADIEKLQPRLKALHRNIIQKQKDDATELQERILKLNDLRHEMEAVYTPKLVSLQATVSAAQEALLQVELNYKRKSSEHGRTLRQLEQQLQEQEKNILHYEQSILQTKAEIKTLKKQNMEATCKVETDYNKWANSRETFLNQFEDQLTQATTELNDLHKVVRENQSTVDRLKQELRTRNKEESN